MPGSVTSAGRAKKVVAMLLIDIESIDPQCLIIPECEAIGITIQNLFTIQLIHPQAKALANNLLPATKAVVEHKGNHFMTYLGYEQLHYFHWPYHRDILNAGPFPCDERGIPFDDPDLGQPILQNLKVAGLLNTNCIPIVWTDGVMLQCNRIIDRMAEGGEL